MHTSTSSSDERSLFYSLRARLQWFIQTIYYYLTCLVIEPGSLKMRQDLKDAIDIDTMIEVHSCFIKFIIERALLGSKLEPIHKAILKILDLAIKLEDAQAVNALASKEALDQQQDMMDLSMAGLGLHTPQKSRPVNSSMRFAKTPKTPKFKDESSDEDEELDVDLSILSIPEDDQDEISYSEQLREMKADFDRLVRFVASGLKGVARAGGGEEARNWDVLGEMFESGLGGGSGSIGYSY
jgi:gamma-tubulin complex component 5